MVVKESDIKTWSSTIDKDLDGSYDLKKDRKCDTEFRTARIRVAKEAFQKGKQNVVKQKQKID